MSVENVTIVTTGQSKVLRLFGPIMLTGGDPSWVVTDRMRRQPVSSWGGRALYGLEIPLLLDGWRSRASVEGDVSWLRGLLAAPNDAGAVGARQLSVSSSGMPSIPYHNASTMDWVAVGFDVDSSSIIRSDDGPLLRCTATLTVQEYVAPPKVKASASFTKSAAAKRVIVLTAKKGDTPLSMSLRKAVRPNERATVKSYFIHHKIIANHKYRIQV